MWRAFVGSCWLGSGCLVLRVDTRENPAGKNGVMATGRPHDIVALRRALDESEAALTSARTSMGAMRVQISFL